MGNPTLVLGTGLRHQPPALRACFGARRRSRRSTTGGSAWRGRRGRWQARSGRWRREGGGAPYYWAGYTLAGDGRSVKDIGTAVGWSH